MPDKIIDMSLKKLKIIYECANKGEINSYFDDAVKKLAKLYGLEWYGQGMEIETGIRDIVFKTKK